EVGRGTTAEGANDGVPPARRQLPGGVREVGREFNAGLELRCPLAHAVENAGFGDDDEHARRPDGRGRRAAGGSVGGGSSHGASHLCPRYLATKTRASSVPLPNRARIWSAKRCGGSEIEISAANSWRTPSVANSRVSPGATRP